MLGSEYLILQRYICHIRFQFIKQQQRTGDGGGQGQASYSEQSVETHPLKAGWRTGSHITVKRTHLKPEV